MKNLVDRTVERFGALHFAVNNAGITRDGLLMPWFAKVHPKFRTPANATILTGIIAASIAMFAPMKDLHHMVSIGTLFAFTMVCGSVLMLLEENTFTHLSRAPIGGGALAQVFWRRHEELDLIVVASPNIAHVPLATAAIASKYVPSSVGKPSLRPYPR